MKRHSCEGRLGPLSPRQFAEAFTDEFHALLAVAGLPVYTLPAAALSHFLTLVREAARLAAHLEQRHGTETSGPAAAVHHIKIRTVSAVKCVVPDATVFHSIFQWRMLLAAGGAGCFEGECRRTATLHCHSL
jgi:hypothetical protein